MSFVRSSQVTSKVAVPVLLAVLLATGIVFIEASPANAAACSTTGATTAYAGGAGTSGDPYLLATAEQLALLSATSADWSKHFKQTANITLAAGCTWTPIGSGTSFNGTYDGGGFTVSGLKTINHDGARIGLISVLNTGGTIKNVGVVDVDFVGKYHVGGLVGESYGTIQNSFATGQIVGKVQTGGLVGSYRGGSISNSYARTSVSYNSVNPNPNNSVEPYIAGGLLGASIGSPGTISYSWSSGLVTTPGAGVNYLIGGVFGGVSSGSNPTFNKVRWDTEASTQSTNPAGSGHVGNSTAQMQTLATYTTDDYDIRSGWEAFNFSTPTNFWGICSAVNDGYPFLLWEYNTDPCLYPASAPAITSITPSSGSLSIAFTAPSSNGGAAISNYKYSVDNGANWITRSPASTASPLVVTGLTNGTSYQVRLLAINSEGDGAVSVAVTGTPAAPTPSPTPTPSTSPTVSVSPTPAAAPATLTVGPIAVLASTGSDLLSNWRFVGVTILVGLALLLISSIRRREPEHDKS